MNPTERLEAEHRIITRMLDAFERFAEVVATTDEPDTLDLIRFVTFCREFADAGHHEKEEVILIPTLVRAGATTSEGTVGTVLREHATERQMLRSIRRIGLAPEPFLGERRQRAVEAIREFVTFMHRHVVLEERTLFPWIREHVSEVVAKEIAERCESFDRVWDEQGDRSFLIEIAEYLCRKYSTNGGTSPQSAER